MKKILSTLLCLSLCLSFYVIASDNRETQDLENAELRERIIEDMNQRPDEWFSTTIFVNVKNSDSDINDVMTFINEIVPNATLRRDFLSFTGTVSIVLPSVDEVRMAVAALNANENVNFAEPVSNARLTIGDPFRHPLSIMIATNEIVVETSDDIDDKMGFINEIVPNARFVRGTFRFLSQVEIEIYGVYWREMILISLPSVDEAREATVVLNTNENVIRADQIHNSDPNWTLPLAPGEISVTLNGMRLHLDVTPIMRENRTLVPFRAIFEALGMEVEWDNDRRIAIGVKAGIRIEIPIDSCVAYVNGTPVELDVPAMIHNERTLVPVRFVAENSGANVEWNQATQTVAITTN